MEDLTLGFEDTFGIQEKRREEDEIARWLQKAQEKSLDHFVATGIYKVRETGLRGKGVRIAVLDSGIHREHEQLAHAYNGGKDFIHDHPHIPDESGHGTFVAGLIAGKDVGIAPEAELYALKVISNKPNILRDETRFREAIKWCIENSIDIVNISAGTRTYNKRMEAACMRAYCRGILIISGAGNDSTGASFPAAFPRVLSVGGVIMIMNIMKKVIFGQPSISAHPLRKFSPPFTIQQMESTGIISIAEHL